MNRILSLSDLAKTLIIIIAIIPFYLSYIVWSYYVLHYDPMPGLIHMDRVQGHIPALQVMILANIALAIIGWGIYRFSWPLEKAFRNVGIGITVIFLTYTGHQVGSLTIATGVVLMSATILGLVLFELGFVIAMMTTPMLIIFGGSFLSALGYMEYSPIFIGSPTGGEHPDIFWVISTATFSLPFCATFFVFSAMLVKQWRAYDQEILSMATLDPLTHLSNRRFLMESFQREMAILNRHNKDDGAISCIILDLDHFKQVNDQHGHQVGDEVLIGAAKALQESVREYDIVGRYGGEEFLIILPKTAEDTAQVVAERCRERIAALQWTQDDLQVLSITASFGVASALVNQNISVNQLIRSADEALYQAKEQGRNRVIMADSILA